MKLKSFRSSLGLAILIGYVTFGLGLSGLAPYSIFGSVFALAGVILGLATSRTHDGLAAGYICLYLLILATWAWSSSTVASGPNTYITACLGGLLAYYAIARRWISWDGLALVLCIPTLVNVGAFLFSINLTETLHGLDQDAAMRRFSGFTGHPNALITRTTLPLVVVTLYSLIRNTWAERWTSKLLVLAAFSCSLFGVYATASKKGLVFVSVCVAALFIGGLLYRRFGSKLKLLGATTGVIVVVATAIGPALFDELEVLARIQAATSGADESTIERSSMVTSGWRLFAESPLIGHGLDSFRVEAGYGTYSHNNAIEMLVNGGILLFGAYYSFFALVLYLLWKRYRRVMPSVFALMLFVSYDLTGITASDRACQIALGLLLAAVVPGAYAAPRSAPVHDAVAEGRGRRG